MSASILNSSSSTSLSTSNSSFGIKQQILRAKSEAETSLNKAYTLRDQWLAASGSNPTGLTQKDIDILGRTFKNHLLALKWDCEDLEELIEVNDRGPTSTEYREELDESKMFIENCRNQMANMTKQLDDCEFSKKLYVKHGIDMNDQSTKHLLNDDQQVQSTVSNLVTSIIENPLAQMKENGQQKYERLQDENGPGTNEEIPTEIQHFDKTQIATSTSVFNNALYEHYEQEDRLLKGPNANQVLNNLTRPDDVYMDPMNNDNEMILEMLETEYYNPAGGNTSVGLLARSSSIVGEKYNQAVKTLFESEHSKLVGLVLSFPILLLLFMMI